MHVVIQIHSFRSKPKKQKSLFSRNKQRSKDTKYFTTASEIKSYQGHLQKHNPQEMITQYACMHVQADSQGHVSHYHELMSRVWPVNAYFSLASLWWAVGEEFQRAGTEKMYSEAVHSKWLPPLSLCAHFRKDFALKWPVFFDLLWV